MLKIPAGLAAAGTHAARASWWYARPLFPGPAELFGPLPADRSASSEG
ncbi:hypothetical protein ACFVT1_25410 [Streptomyces sp. NPDC057963]